YIYTVNICLGSTSNLWQTRFDDTVCNPLASFVRSMGSCELRCQDPQLQMEAPLRVPLIYGLSSSLFELTSVPMFLLSSKTLDQASRRPCVSESSYDVAFISFYNRTISESGH
ncbi:mCG145872, partial [Mus musculus]